MACQGDTVRVQWLDAWPGRLFPADGAIVRFEASGFPEVGAWDDDPRVEIRAIGEVKGGYAWQAQMSNAGGWPGRIRFTALPRPDFPAAVSAVCP
jgi:hypothetical protein